VLGFFQEGQGNGLAFAGGAGSVLGFFREGQGVCSAFFRRGRGMARLF